MVWNFDVSLGFGFGMPYYSPACGIGMPNYLYSNNFCYTNPMQFSYNINNYTNNPFYVPYNPVLTWQNFNFNDYINNPCSLVQPQNYYQTNQYTMSEVYMQPNFSASEQITSLSNTTSSAKTEKKKGDVFDDYNADSGKLLAQNALEYSHDFHNKCSLHVNNAIEASGLGNSTDADAYEMIGVLNSNPNFKSISKDTDVTKLPAGCIVVYDKGVSGYSDEYGHVEIAAGDGRGVSDGIHEKIKPNPSAIYMPIKA